MCSKIKLTGLLVLGKHQRPICGRQSLHWVQRSKVKPEARGEEKDGNAQLLLFDL